MEHGPSCKVAALESGADVATHISKLPDEILSHILTFLNMKETIQTRLLSRKWSELPLYMSDLVFDSTLINIDLEDDASLETIPLAQKYQFVERVNKLLKTIIVYKPLALTVWLALGSEFTSHIDNWVSLAVEMDCEKLDLEFKFATLDEDDDEPYNFPCHLLLSRKKSYLKRLSLCECQFNPTPEVAHKLNSLTSLTLAYVFMEANDLEVILLGCLNLECLELVDCEVMSSLRICNQNLKLKNLIVTALIVEANIELSIPNLQICKFFGGIQDFTFSRMLQLKTIDFSIDETYQRGLRQLLDELSRKAPRVETLCLACHFDQNLSFVDNNNHKPMFNNLTQLELTARENYGWNMVTYMLYNSPQLKVLVIDKGYNLQIDEPNWTYPQLVPACLSSCLNEVRFQQFDGKDFELKFAGYILKNATVLKDMKIKLTISGPEVDLGWKIDHQIASSSPPEGHPHIAMVMDLRGLRSCGG